MNIFIWFFSQRDDPGRGNSFTDNLWIWDEGLVLSNMIYLQPFFALAFPQELGINSHTRFLPSELIFYLVFVFNTFFS